MENIPYTSAKFFMIRAVDRLDGTMTVGGELPDFRETVEEATERAKEIGGTSFVFEITPIIKVTTRSVTTVRRINHVGKRK